MGEGRDSNNTTIHQLFESRVDRHPDAVAVVFDGHQLTYHELECRSNGLAHLLVAMGVGPDVLVALFVDRSLDMLVGLLGILKAGGAYVPLDPAYPAARIAFMLEDSESPIVLTQSHLRSSLPDRGATVLCLDTERETVAGAADTRVTGRTTAASLAYVIYTSGSTGQPKGVEVPHRGVVNLLGCLAHRPGMTPDDRLLAVTTLSFDMAGVEIYLPLAVGARTIIVSRTVASDGTRLAEAIARHEATMLQATPATWRLLLEAGWAGHGGFKVLCGGETLTRELARSLKPRCGELWNLYGPTETSIWSTIHRVEEGEGSVPIGRPIANTDVWILDEKGEPVKPGATGELCLGGVGLARGYRNRAALTAERFIANPFDPTPGARLYRTGDLARTRSDGALEHLGRLDSQVKIRGFRIELGEIEAVLEQQPSVRQAIVMAREDVSHERQLVAYVVPERDAPTNRELRDGLGLVLPDYMVPGVFVVMDALPLTPNGKVDRQALPAPDRSRPDVGGDYVPPRSPGEEILAKAWAGVLRIDRVGVHDNLFDLGGDSLKMAQIATRIREAFRVSVPLEALFDNPTVVGLLQVIESQQGEEPTAPELPLRRVPRADDMPLSFAQERVWFIHQLDPQNLAYNFQSTLRFRGRLNLAALEQSLAEVVRRHEIYRTTFPTVDGRPRQVVHPPERFELPVRDFSTLSRPEQDDAWKVWSQAEFQHRFDLARLPLVRWTVLRWGETDHTLVHMEHHLVHDGWSFNVFLTELVDLYAAFSRGNPSPLADLPVQFADFARWQHAWMRGEVLETQLAYWRKKLQGAPPLLELPTKGPRPATQTFRGRAPRAEVPLALCDDLRALSRAEGTTLFMTMLAGFIILLHRYTGEDDVGVGTFFANRRTRASESLIGMILNNVVVRTSLADNPTVREFMGQVRHELLDSSNFQDVPFDRVVEAVHPKRDLSHNPLFQVVFSFHDEPMPERGLDGLDVTLTPVISNHSAKFDLGVIGIPHSAQVIGAPPGTTRDGLTMIWEHSSDLFEIETIHRMIAHYHGLLAGMVADPARRISDLPLGTESETAEQIAQWNDTARDYPRHVCAHTLIRAQAEKTPDAIAVVSGDQALTYLELERRSNQLARHLLKAWGETRLAGLCVERSLDMVVGLIGIWKAGGAYVPIDPAFPPDRQRFMIQDSGVEVVVAHASGQAAWSGVTLVSLDADASLIEAEADTVIGESEATPDDLAYVIYTSGSTGKPKGVEVSHRALVNLLTSMACEPGITKADRLLAVTTLSFDIAALELCLPLTVGGRVVIAGRDTAADGQALAALIRASGATIMQATPTTWRLLVDAGWEGAESLRVLCGGEPLSRPLAQELLGRVEALWNLYGPTETTIWSTVARVESGVGPVPIGRPISNTQAYVLDRYGQPVPVGVVGEVFIGGDGVARGYRHRPELTAERFIADPFREGGTVYRTGDLARYRPDGALECLGRTDHQVKVRGFRIEPGEIEAALLRHPAVKAAVVMVRADLDGGRLVAYVVPRGPSVPTGDLAAHLRDTLPPYMIPSAWVELESLPLTPNGKVDRRALPEPVGSGAPVSGRGLPPRTASEEAMVEIWRTALQVPDVGIHDDFFALGGHSLVAAMVANRIRETFGVEVPVVALFQSPTVSELTRLVEELQPRTS